jgi:hypothetical protein
MDGSLTAAHDFTAAWVATWPPLTETQRENIAILFAGNTPEPPPTG